MQNWLEFDEFCKLVDLDKDVVEDMIKREVLTTKKENDILYIEASKGAVAVMPKESEIISANALPVGSEFVEKTIGTILQLHKEVLDGKDETLEALKSENNFLKEALLSMQTLYDEDRKTVDNLNEQLKTTQKELEFCRRKYKMMWNKAIENHK